MEIRIPDRKIAEAKNKSQEAVKTTASTKMTSGTNQNDGIDQEAPYGRRKDGTPQLKRGRKELARHELPPVPQQYIMQSGPDGTKPNRHVKEYAKPFTEEAVNMMVATMRDVSAPAAVRLTAAFGIVDRAWGKPKETLELEAPAEGLRKVLNDISSEDLTDLVRALRNPPIDVTPTVSGNADAKKPGP